MGLVGSETVQSDSGGAASIDTRRACATMLLASVAALALGVGTASAQEAADPAAAQESANTLLPAEAATLLDKITVVSRTDESAIDSMASVSHIGEEQLERRMATTPQDVLFGVPGVALQSDANRTASSVNIRGLQDFGRVAVIVDGARQNFQRSGHGTQSMFWLDPELIKQVDVVRGPVANTYGSGAIGGVVFYETKDAEDFLREGETWAASATGRYDTNGKGWTTSATGAYRFNDAVDVLGNLVWRDFGDYKDGGGEEVPGSGFDVLSGLLKATIRPTELSELKLGWVGADDSWTEGLDAYDMDVKQNTFTGRYHVTDEDESWLDLHVNMAVNRAGLDQTYLRDVRQFDSETGGPIIVPAGSQTTYDLDTYGIDIWNTSRFETGALSHELTYGGDWVSDDVVTANAGGGMDVYTPSGKRRVSGAYIQEKFTYDWLEVIGALRYDSYQLDSDVGEIEGDRISPRITVGVSPFEQIGLAGLQIYGTYAEGYRSPSLSETLISGLHPNGVAFPFLPNSDLRPETAKTWEFGVNYSVDGVIQGDDSLRLKAAYFNNDVDDYIGGATLSAFDPTADCPFVPGAIPICFQYQNFANAKIAGFELESVYEAGWGFAGLSVSIVDGHTISYDGEREDLLTIPSSQVTGQLGFRFLEDKLTVGGEVQYNGKPEGNPIADKYTLVNAFASYQATEDFRLDFRADNIFDVKYTNPLNASATDIVYEPGVTLKLGATMRFGG
ncbi:TonB-dependent heme/hemoglobin receptor family protein [Mesorhizobium alhagi CCNWXJ12-2]|jgi:hemoglobin/transferrin/lactoferrin receptor protein|uniref:TonB-dependent heme/hemoglobin receptor family protein n=2 Tax=Allomesorhizobium alhagi TaxID=475067 RepID=H0HSS8_9HYPH|nr:TonB-dependent heme/hemoglobin receptor family protein [Mesorhizobium alhagi CCNWXJ12-2]